MDISLILALASAAANVILFIYAKSIKVHDHSRDLEQLKKTVYDSDGQTRIFSSKNLEFLVKDLLDRLGVSGKLNSIDIMKKDLEEKTYKSSDFASHKDTAKKAAELVEKMNSLHIFTDREIALLKQGIANLNDHVSAVEGEAAEATIKLSTFHVVLTQIEHKLEKHEVEIDRLKEDTRNAMYMIKSIQQLHLHKGCTPDMIDIKDSGLSSIRKAVNRDE